MHTIQGRMLIYCLLLLLTVLGLVQEPPTTPAPTEPPAAVAPPLAGEVPPPAEPAPLPAPGTRRLRVSAERYLILGEQGLYQFIGNVTIETEGTTIRCAEATYDDATQLIRARGNVSISTPDGNTYWGNVLEYDVRTRDWQFLDWSVEYPAGFLGPPFIAPLFVGGEELSGLPRGLRARNARVTTCDLPDPHYILISERVDIYPGEKLIAYDTDVYVLGQKILHIPWFFIDLRQRRSPIVPEAGQNDFEGYYLRLLYQYVMNPENLGGVRLDLTEKLGTGVGVNHFYTIPRGSGEAFAYVRQDGSEYALRVDHTQALPADVMVTLRGDVRQDSLFTFQPTTLTNLNTGVSRVTTHSSTQLTATRALNESTFSTDNTSANLTYNHRVERGTLNYNAAYSRYGTSGFGVTSAADEELWNRVQWMRRLSAGQLNLRIDARTDVDGDAYTGDSFFSGLQRLPEVYLVSEQSDLKWDVLRRIPSRFTVGWGHFDEEPGNTRLDRYLFNWQLQNLNLPLGRRMRLTPTAEVRQTFYGDEDFTALYRYNFTLPLRQEIGPYVVSNLRYSTQQAHGFTPFRFDNVYPYETITESLEFNNNRNLRMNLTGGRDLEYGRWQDAAFRADVEFAPNVTMTQAVAYDLNNKRWRDLVSQYRWANNPLMTFDLSTRYDPQGGQLRNVSTNLQWVVTPKWRLNWLGGYDGIQREVLYNEFLVVRDLHCWDAAVYYSYQRKYVYLYFRLKALNLPLPGFGIGRGGQILDTAQGFPF